jgi:hypothetical protein
MRRSLRVLAVLVTLGIATPVAYAAEGDPPCLADTERLCRFVPGTGGFIQGCLEQHWDELSPGCRKHVDSTTRDGVKIGDACEDDVDRFCDDVDPGGGQRVACLLKNRDSLSSRCRKTLDDVAAKDDAAPKDDVVPEPAPARPVDVVPKGEAVAE